MLRCSKFLMLLLLLSPAIGFARGVPNGESPAFTPVPELNAGFDLIRAEVCPSTPNFRKLGVPQSRGSFW